MFSKNNTQSVEIRVENILTNYPEHIQQIKSHELVQNIFYTLENPFLQFSI